MIRLRCRLVGITDAPGEARTVTFEPVGNEGIGSEYRFARKPVGQIQLRVDNPLALRVIESSQEFYFDLVPILE